MRFFLTFASGMMGKYLIFCLLLSLSVALCSGQNIAQTEVEDALRQRGEAKILIKAEKADLQRLADVVSLDYKHGDKYLAYVNRKQFDAFLGSGFAFELFKDDESKAVNMAADPSQMQTWNRYPTYETYLSVMQNFSLDYPALCTLDTIGTSENGRLLLCLRLTNDSCEKNQKPKFFYGSSIHGDELTGAVMLLRLADSLLSNCQSNEAIRELLSCVELYICPLSNPDGTYAGGNASVAEATRYNANHIDLNRNFPDPVMGSHYDGEQYQAETMAFMQYAKAKRFDLSANLHGGAEVCNYPWDCRTSEQGAHADRAWFETNCSKFVDQVRACSPDYYFTDVSYNGITAGGDWYTVYGGRQDWHNHFVKCREITIEISATKTPSSSFLPRYWNYLGKALASYVSNTTKGIKGTVTDSLTAECLDSVLVEVAGLSGEEAVVFSKANGFYFRALSAGNYTLTFSKEGYESKTIVLTLPSDSTIRCNTALKKCTLSNLEPPAPQLSVELYPNPAVERFTLKTDRCGEYRILSPLGTLLQQGMLHKGENIIEAKTLPKGCHIIRILSYDKHGSTCERKIIVQ